MKDSTPNFGKPNITGLAKMLSLAAGLSVAPIGLHAADQVKQALMVQTDTVKQNKASQEKINKVADETSRLLDEYRLVISETESLKAYNEQMQKLISSQTEEMNSIAEQINSIEVTNKEVVPLMQRMIASLEKFVELDVPFLIKERRQRVESLKTMMDRADVSTSEKFRRVLEAFQVENEYGRNIEAYAEEIEVDGQSRTVDFLRIGRVVLLYQTLDGKSAKLWDVASKTWVDLPDSYRGAIRDGLKIARKQSAPDLLVLPVKAPEGVGA